MGISKIDIHRSLVTPDTPPPELESHHASASAYRSAETHYWRSVAPISPPMSSYDKQFKSDMSAGKNLEDSRARDMAAQSAPRQQLPSLSSIFGPPSQMRPLHSPMSERPSPLRSPLDRPPSASANSERSYSNSYFPNVSTPVAQPRSVYEPRLEQERTALPSVSHRFPGPLSPRNHEFDRAQNAPRNDSTTSSRWSSQSSQSDSRRPEYVFGTREAASSFRPVNDRLPYPPIGQKPSHDSLGGYREQLQRQPQPSGHSSNLLSSGASEAAPVKDGLGPKIWTGTHFLPRFVRQAEVPGEGLCYFYDDGSHCKTVIDGEQVNAHWGVTKAGKPRKRLAIACLTCREKKIKCDPDFPRCVQCEKFGRVCKFKNAPRGGHNTSPSNSPGSHSISQVREHEQQRPRSNSSASVSPRTTTLPHPSPEHADLGSKRVRVSYEHYKPTSNETAPPYPPQEVKRTPLSWHQRELPRVHEDLLCRPWQTEPRHL
ncbi:hypothetical protein BKA67DRAFT_660991 [Truncatella angustata]|uniref:Zn(2)-C6 fungal-type domain-containing protein n=1 Tax=Truncatella angustata TaxID=152316 RepID=A0A9P8UHE5_9PEZI|nr:uncharacterized protein BKA67DRAFT_660991 [Truncatella angustata]KAH6652226.1 hypothetical protein BKA67DRAFT_660991 [Truncatella angustata]